MRTCAGCGRRAPQRELLRFTARDGDLVAGRTEPGRGAYTCRSVACFERAATRGTFARVLRRQVRVGPELRRLYTDAASGAGRAVAARRKYIGESHG
ncbi:MAG: YlxR family protein [Gaiellaceae bacterium]